MAKWTGFKKLVPCRSNETGRDKGSPMREDQGCLLIFAINPVIGGLIKIK